MAKRMISGSPPLLVAPLALFMLAVPVQVDLNSGSIESASAFAKGPGGGDRGGPGGRGGPGRGGPGAEAAGQAIDSAGVSASGNETAKAATNPDRTGLSKAKDVVGTTPAAENGNAMSALSDAQSRNDTEADSENDDFSLSKFGQQMGEDAKAALDAIAGLFSDDGE
jgi:hypothetical protein